MLFRYSNPHLDTEPGIIRDAFIVREGDTYYLTGTLRPIWSGPNPGVPLWSSKDLKTWVNHGLIIDRNRIDDRAWYKDRWWAPELHRTREGWYLTVNCRNETLRRRHGVSIWFSKSIEGPFQILNPNHPFPHEEEQFYNQGCPVIEKYISNDASLFTDEDGRHYLFWSCWRGIWQAEIELPSCRMIGDKRLAIPAADTGWDRSIEGPVLFREGKWIYLFFSGFGRNYDIGVARSDSISGPWVQQHNNPIIEPRHPLTHVGHNGVFKGPDGNWWISYLMQFDGKDSPERLAIDPIYIMHDGWIFTPAPTLGTQIV